ncbi:protein SpaM [Pseudomonas asplenii]|uniref:Antigen type M protein n=1 Tax=Pseudomonas asplenii TaxID=53407 RepID=A0A0M9GH59_9PSED|nr:protein SpaM [Pseudomonas fuscovaginae]KPA90814.1 Antigen type M protein [Pseudomonas fuscovaginae]KPA92145.1 surface presentation of antigen type M protein [Pseudomonas fuscovaginae]
MSSLADIDRLLGFTTWRLRREEIALLRLRQRRAQLLREGAALEEQEVSLRALLDSHRADNCVLDPWQLRETLRRQAVIRRQIQLLALERRPLHEQHAQLDGQIRQGQQALELIRRRQSKYAVVRRRLSRELQLERLRRDEAEVDELMGSRR